MQNSAEKQENEETHRKYRKFIKCRKNEDQCRTVQKSKKIEKITENSKKYNAEK